MRGREKWTGRLQARTAKRTDVFLCVRDVPDSKQRRGNLLSINKQLHLFQSVFLLHSREALAFFFLATVVTGAFLFFLFARSFSRLPRCSCVDAACTYKERERQVRGQRWCCPESAVRSRLCSPFNICNHLLSRLRGTSRLQTLRSLH